MVNITKIGALESWLCAHSRPPLTLPVVWKEGSFRAGVSWIAESFVPSHSPHREQPRSHLGKMAQESWWCFYNSKAYPSPLGSRDSACISQSSPENQNQQDMYTYLFILRNCLPLPIWRLSKSKICGVGQQAGDPGKRCSLSPKAVHW